jgi:uncharacterized protein
MPNEHAAAAATTIVSEVAAAANSAAVVSVVSAVAKVAKAFHVLAKPIGPACNLDCRYCFYLKKDALFPPGASRRMRDEVLEAFTRQYIQAQPEGAPEVNFAWQGGEPTLLGIDFFRRAVACQRRHARPGLRVVNSIQTNGVLLDDAWGTFLAENDFLVGLSLDGPRRLHDLWRVDKRGEPTFDRVMRGLEVLRRHKVEFNVLAVVHDANSRHPEETYDFFKSVGARFIQFIPLVEPDGQGGLDARSVQAEPFGRFLVGVFDRWLASGDVGRVFVQDFDAMLALVMGLPSPTCVNAPTCGRALAIEHDGSLFSCDHYVAPAHRLGNAMEATLAEMVEGRSQRAFGHGKRDSLPGQCRRCEFLSLCNGGCPKDRLIQSPDGEPGLNALCAGLKTFFAHALPTMEKMARCLALGRPARDWRQAENLEAGKSNVNRQDAKNAKKSKTRIQNAKHAIHNKKRRP